MLQLGNQISLEINTRVLVLLGILNSVYELGFDWMMWKCRRASNCNDIEAEELALKHAEDLAMEWGQKGNPCTLNTFWNRIRNCGGGVGVPDVEYSGHKRLTSAANKCQKQKRAKTSGGVD